MSTQYSKNPTQGRKELDESIQLDPPRAGMVKYIKTAIEEGYQPEHEGSVADLNVIDSLGDNSLNREFGKCWQWYNMGGLNETLQKQVNFEKEHRSTFAYDSSAFENAAKPLIKWLNDNANPHASVVVDAGSATLFTGELYVHTDEYLKD